MGACLLEGVVAQGKAPPGVSPPGPDRQPPVASGPAADRHIPAARPQPCGPIIGAAWRPAPPPGLYRPRPGMLHHCQLSLGLQPVITRGTEATALSAFRSTLPTYAAPPAERRRRPGPLPPPSSPLCVSAAGRRDAAGLEARHAGAAPAVRRGSRRRGGRGVALPTGRAPRRLRPRGATGRRGEAARPGAGRAGPRTAAAAGFVPGQRGRPGEAWPGQPDSGGRAGRSSLSRGPRGL